MLFFMSNPSTHPSALIPVPETEIPNPFPAYLLFFFFFLVILNKQFLHATQQLYIETLYLWNPTSELSCLLMLQTGCQHFI